MFFEQKENPTRQALLQITENKCWSNEANKLLNQPFFDAKFVSEFHTHWTEAGHRMRSQINNDKKLISLLRLILPKYNGQSISLYRGENVTRWKAKQIGLCWSSSIEIARMFARERNAIESGGMLLEANCPPEVIISGPSRHSLYLGESEYTIDPYMLSTISVTEQFPITIV